MIKRGILLMVAVGAFTIGAQAQAPRGVVYIESNADSVPGHNSILAFQRDHNGHLTQVGEFFTGGTGVHPLDISLGNLAGTLGPFDSDQNLIFNWDATRVFAVNSGSDTIAVFDVKRDGALVPVKGSPFPSGGRHPVSVGIASCDDTLVVVNKDYDLTRPGFNASQRAPNYTSFRVTENGKLLPVPHSTLVSQQGGTTGPGNSTPTQALVSPSGRLIFDADTFGTSIRSLAVLPNGRLTPAAVHGTPASEFIPFPLIVNPAARPFPLGLVAHPREPIFYAGFVFEGKVGAYTYDRSGEFQFVRSAVAGAGVCWIATNASGSRLYTSNTLAGTISVLDSSNPLNPVKIQEFTLAGPPAPAPGLPGSGPAQLTLDVRGEYLYVITQKTLDIMTPDANALHALRLAADGTIASETDHVIIPVSPSCPQGVIAR